MGEHLSGKKPALNGNGTPPEIVWPRLRWTDALPVAPIPIFLVLLVILAGLDVGKVFEPPVLLPILNTLFLFILPLSIIYVSAKGFLTSGYVPLLMLGCATFSLGFGSLLAGLVIPAGGGPNAVVTLHNSSALLAAICHSIGAVLAFMGVGSHQHSTRKKAHVLFGYLGILVLLALLALAIKGKLVPVFFVQGIGPTFLRQVILVSAVVLFLISGLLFAGLYLGSGAKILYWYSLALLLIALGLFCVFLQKSLGGPIGWLGRGSQYLAGIYLLVAVIGASRQLRVKGLSIQGGFANLFRHRLEVLVQDRTSQLYRANEKLSHEVAQRKQALERLRESEERFRNVFEQGPLGIAIVGLDYRWVSVNEALCGMVGYTKDELTNLTFVDITHPDDIEADVECAEKLAVGEIPWYTMEKRYIKKNGDIIWINLTGSIIRDEQGKPLYFMSMIEDITERKKTEQRLQRLYTQNELILNSAWEGIFGIDRDGCHTFVNPAAARMLGYEPHELLGQRSHSTWHHSKPNQSPYPEEDCPICRTLRDGTSHHVRDEVFWRKDGGRFLVECMTSPIVEEGEVTGAVVSFFDVTELRKSRQEIEEARERLELVLQGADLGFWDWQVRSDIAVVNERAAEIVGYSLNEIEQKFSFWESLLHPDDKRRSLEKVSNHLAGITDYYEDEYRVKHKSGDWKWILSRARVMERDEQGNPLRMTGTYRDITERKITEEALVKSEGLRKEAQRIAQMGHWELDLATGIPSWSVEIFHIFGLDPEQGEPSLGAHRKIIHPEDWEVLYDSITRASIQGVSYDIEFRVVRPEGSIRWMNGKGYPIRNPEGEIVRLFGTAQDITGRKRAEEQLQKSEALLRSIFESTTDCILVWDKDYNYLYANQAAIDHVGTARENVIGKNMRDGLGHVPDFMRLWMGRVDQIFATGQPMRVSDSMTIGGKVVHSESVLSPIMNADDSIFAVGVLYRDISARRKAEEAQRRLATAIEQSAESVVITDTDGVIQYVNPAAERITGFARSEILGNTPRIFKSGEHDKAFYEQLWNTIKTGNVWSGRIVNKKKDGTLYYGDATISPVRDASGKITNFVSVKRDVTEHLELSKQLAQAQKMEAIGTLAGGVAHDFNNILQVVLGYSELLLAEQSQEGASSEDLRKVYTAAQKGADLVKRLLSFSRKVEMTPRPLDLNHQIEQLEKMLTRTIPKMVKIELNLADGLSRVHADPTQMDQILMNLAVNARDAMPEGGNLIIETANVFLDEDYARTHLRIKSGEYVLVSVSDTGHGMDRDTLDHIFEPFYTTKEAGKGTGLGLATVYGIVTQHGGQIHCYSEPGHGTTFKIYLPVAKMETEPDVAASGEMPAFGTETILLVDDEAFVRDLGKKILERSGYTVLTASNGKQALDLYKGKRDKISLVILDLIMPEMGGKQCLEELLKIDPRVRALIASGFALNGVTKEAIETGAKGFVSKPYNVKQVLQAVRGALDAE